MPTLKQLNRPNMMRPMTIERGENGIPHRVYDLSIENIEERRAKSQIFGTGQAASKFLGMVAHKISYWREVGRKFYSAKHDKYFAIRIEPNQD